MPSLAKARLFRKVKVYVDMTVILQAAGSILSIALMIALGWQLAQRGWFGGDRPQLLAKLVTTVSLPTMMIWNLMSHFDRTALLGLGSGLVVPVLSMALSLAIGEGWARAIGVPRQRKGVFCSMFLVSNAIFIGLPVNLALFGEVSIPYVLLYYVANTTFLWTVAVQLIAGDGGKGGAAKLDLATVKRILTPPLLGFLLAMLLILLGLRLPAFVLDTCRYLGAMTTPLSMLFIGIAISSVKLSGIRVDREMISELLGRFVVAPLTIVALNKLFPMPELMFQVFVVQAAMPVVTQTAIIAKAYGADERYAAVLTTVSTLLAMLVIPVYRWLLV